MHTLLAAGAYSPAGHSPGAVAPAVHAAPLGQLLQPACDVRSVASLQLPALHGSGTLVPSPQKWPCSHGWHAVAPSELMYEPSAQRSHAPSPSLAPYVPALHGIALLAPTGQKLPASQTEQSSALVMPEPLPMVPAGQSCTTLEPCTQKAPSSQARHAVAP